MRAYVVDVWNGETKAVDKDWNLDEYYKTIGCDCIDIAVRCIDGHPFNIVCDDEGFLKMDVRIGACEANGLPALAGTLVVFGMDPDTYDLAGLTDSEVEAIGRRLVRIVDHDEGGGYPCVLID